MSGNTVRSRRILLRNFTKSYGKEKLAKLVSDFSIGTSGELIAQELGVTRARISQWRQAFGYTLRTYQVHEDIQAIADEGQTHG